MNNVSSCGSWMKSLGSRCSFSAMFQHICFFVYTLPCHCSFCLLTALCHRLCISRWTM